MYTITVDTGTFQGDWVWFLHATEYKLDNSKHPSFLHYLSTKTHDRLKKLLIVMKYTSSGVDP